MYYRTPGFPILPYLPEFAQIHVIESVMLSNHLIFCHPLLLLPWIFSSIIVFSDWAFHIRWPKYWSFSFNISPCNEYSGLTSFRIDWFWSPGSPRNSQESSSVSQFKSINSSVLSLLHGNAKWCSLPTGIHYLYLYTVSQHLDYQQSPIYFLSSWICLFWTYHVNGIMHYVIFSNYLPSLNIMYLRFSHI